MLRITVQQTEAATGITLEGRVAGPWAVELDRAWTEVAPSLSSKKLSLDLRNVTYADAEGKRVLRDIYVRTHAEVVANTPWTQYLAAEITRERQDGTDSTGNLS